jgi:uncharacterized protein YjbI with pentapeptide repeats
MKSMQTRQNHQSRTIIYGQQLIVGLTLGLFIFVVFLGVISAPAIALDYVRESLIGVDFSGKDLRDAEFTKANLRQSNLSHTDLRGVSFFAANLEEANLEGADLRGATLDSARFNRSNLTNAVLEGAFVANARFAGAIITGADFTDVLIRSDIEAQLCKIAEGTNPTTGRETRETLFCP